MVGLLAGTCDSCGKSMAASVSTPGERAQADLARFRALLLELGRLAEGAGAPAAHLSDAFVVSYHPGDFDEAEQARQALAAIGALCGVVRRTAGDAQDHLAGVDPELPGLLTEVGR